MFDFRQITLFCLEKRLSKHKMTIFSKHFGGSWPLWLPLLATPTVNNKACGVVYSQSLSTTLCVSNIKITLICRVPEISIVFLIYIFITMQLTFLPFGYFALFIAFLLFGVLSQKNA